MGNKWKRRLTLFAKNKIDNVKYKILDLIGKENEHKFGELSIILPHGHMLPKYKKRHKNYDRFLPHLSTYVSPGETIIDVGANVGDTLAGMIERNPWAKYICIEADDTFFRQLNKNISRIKTLNNHVDVFAIKELIGNGQSGVRLEGHGGTKHAVVGTGGSIKSVPLSVVMAKLPSQSRIRILKSDIDGFDYDVINSSIDIIREHKPIVYFECEYSSEDQKLEFERSMARLGREGYLDWSVFDNYGDIILRTDDINNVVQIIDYIWRQNVSRSTRTVYYLDIMACVEDDKQLIDNVLNGYGWRTPPQWLDMI